MAFKDHRGNALPLVAALADAGHEVRPGPLAEPSDPALVDFDGHPGLGRFDRLFVYPHGGGVPAMGDGQWPTARNTRGWFVSGPGQAEVLDLAEFPRPVAVIGFHLCPLAPFRSTEPHRVLLAPGHPLGNGWMHPMIEVLNPTVHDRLAALPDVELTVRLVESPALHRITPRRGVNYVHGVPDVRDAWPVIDAYDMVVSTPGTFSALAVARGCPVVMYGQGIFDDCDGQDLKPAAHAWRYRDLVRYPFDALDDDDLAGTLRRAAKSDHEIAPWRSRFIGPAFDPAMFVRTFERAVSDW